MSVNGKQLKQLLQSNEFSIVVERIVSIYSRTLLKKIQCLENQLENVVNLNQRLVENFSKCEIYRKSEQHSQPNNVTKDNVVIEEKDVRLSIKSPKNQNGGSGLGANLSQKINSVIAENVDNNEESLKDLNTNAVKDETNDKHDMRNSVFLNFDNAETDRKSVV